MISKSDSAQANGAQRQTMDSRGSESDVSNAISNQGVPATPNALTASYDNESVELLNQEYIQNLVRSNVALLLGCDYVEDLTQRITSGERIVTAENELIGKLSQNNRAASVIERYQFSVEKFIRGIFQGGEAHSRVMEFPGGDPANRLAFVMGGEETRIGGGGLGVVQFALAEGEEGALAYKIPRADASNGAVFAAREAEYLKAINGMGAPLCLAFNQNDHGILMRHHLGVPLNNLKGQPLSKEACYRILLSAAFALREAHNRNIAHGDLSHNNIILDENTGKSIILDFGLGRDPKHKNEVTIAGDLRGTPGQMSADVIADGTQMITMESDINDLGANVLYPLLTQGKEFRQDQKQNLLKLIRNRSVISRKMIERQTYAITDLAKSDSKSAELLKKMTSADPSERLTVHQLLDELTHLIYKGKYASADDIPESERGLKLDPVPAIKPKGGVWPKHSRFEQNDPETMGVRMADAIRKKYPVKVKSMESSKRKRLVYGGALTALLGLAGAGMYLARDDGEDKPAKLDASAVVPREKFEPWEKNPAPPMIFEKDEKGRFTTTFRILKKDSARERPEWADTFTIPPDAGMYILDGDGADAKRIGRIYQLGAKELMKLQGVTEVKDLVMHFRYSKRATVFEYHFPSRDGDGVDSYVSISAIGQFIADGTELFRTLDTCKDFAFLRAFERQVERVDRMSQKNFQAFWKGRTLPIMKISIPQKKEFSPEGPPNELLKTYRNSAADSIETMKVLTTNAQQQTSSLDSRKGMNDSTLPTNHLRHQFADRMKSVSADRRHISAVQARQYGERMDGA